MMKYSVQIDLLIRDLSSNPQAITEQLKVQADTALMKGERNPSLGLPKSNIWLKQSEASPADAYLEEHWQSLADKFEGKEALIRQAVGQDSVRLSIIVDGSDRFPPVTIPAGMIRFAGEVGADIDVDVYQ
jgi:hypothetical protein